MTPTDNIPDEIWLHIALFAEMKALFALRLVSFRRRECCSILTTVSDLQETLPFDS